VRLVGVAGLEGELREIGRAAAREGEEALEAEDALHRLGAVADGSDEAAAELAVGDAQGGGEAVDRRVGGGGDGADERVRGGGVGAVAKLVGERGQLERGIVRRGDPLGDVIGFAAPEVCQRDRGVEELAGRQAQGRAGGADSEADAEDAGVGGTWEVTGPVAGPATSSRPSTDTMSTQASGKTGK
jgi:hypothetical protein